VKSSPTFWTGSQKDSRRSDSSHEVLAVDAVAVAQQVLRRGIIGERLDYLLSCPAGTRLLANIIAKPKERGQRLKAGFVSPVYGDHELMAEGKVFERQISIAA